jgi:hypothetical protein
MLQFFFHCSGYEALYEHVPREALPREYGGKLASVEELTGECNGIQANSQQVSAMEYRLTANRWVQWNTG